MGRHRAPRCPAPPAAARRRRAAARRRAGTAALCRAQRAAGWWMATAPLAAQGVVKKGGEIEQAGGLEGRKSAQTRCWLTGGAAHALCRLACPVSSSTGLSSSPAPCSAWPETSRGRWGTAAAGSAAGPVWGALSASPGCWRLVPVQLSACAGCTGGPEPKLLGSAFSISLL